MAFKTAYLEFVRGGIPSVAVKCVGFGGTPMAKATHGIKRRSCTKAWVANRIRYPGSPLPKRCLLLLGATTVAKLTREVDRTKYGRKIKLKGIDEGPAQAVDDVD